MVQDALFNIGLTHFLVLSFLLAGAGVATLLTKRNAIAILMGVELILNAAAINLVAFNRYAWPVRASGDGTPAIDGQMFAVFIIVLAAAEAAVALAIFLNYYNNFNSIDVERADEISGS